MKNQCLIGDTSVFGKELEAKDGVTLIGWNSQNPDALVHMLSAASQARFKDGIVHMDARLLESILQIRLTSSFGFNVGRSDKREMKCFGNNENPNLGNGAHTNYTSQLNNCQ